MPVLNLLIGDFRVFIGDAAILLLVGSRALNEVCVCCVCFVCVCVFLAILEVFYAAGSQLGVYENTS